MVARSECGVSMHRLILGGHCYDNLHFTRLVGLRLSLVRYIAAYQGQTWLSSEVLPLT